MTARRQVHCSNIDLLLRGLCISKIVKQVSIKDLSLFVRQRLEQNRHNAFASGIVLVLVLFLQVLNVFLFQFVNCVLRANIPDSALSLQSLKEVRFIFIDLLYEILKRAQLDTLPIGVA